MSGRRIGAGSGLVAAACAASALLAGCGGGGGDIGIGIATIGVSAILAGASPGWAIRDPNLSTPVSGAAGVTTTVLPESPAPSLGAGETLDRVIIAGGHLLPPITISGVATGTASSDTLEVALLYRSWDANATRVTLVTASAAIGATRTAFTVTLDFSRITAGTAVFGNPLTNPGDQFTLRFKNTGAGTIELDPLATRVAFTSAQSREALVRVRAFPAGGFTVAVAPQLTAVGNSGSASRITPAGPTTVKTGKNQPTVLRAGVVDSGGQPLAGVALTFTAPDATAPVTVTAVTDGIGIAAVAFSWPASGTFAADVRLGGLAPLAFAVTVTDTAVRAFDGLDSFVIQSDLVTMTANAPLAVGLDAIAVTTGASGGLDVGNSAGKTTIPSSVEYTFARHVTVGAAWRYELSARTRSFLPTATATFRVAVVDPNNNDALVAISPTLTATVALGRFVGELTEVAPLTRVMAVPGTAGTAFEVLDFQFLTGTSSDAATPGIEVITDPVLPALLRVPGPAVFATTSSRYLVSSPDPRQ